MLTDKQLKAIHLLVYEGKLKKDVAAEIEVIPETISNWFRSEEFVAEHNKVRQNYLQEIASLALKKMISLALNAESESVQFSAAKDLMSRSGMDAIQKQEITQKTITVGVVEDEHTTEPEEEHIQLEIPTSSDGLPETN